jgi:hypothetical protein
MDSIFRIQASGKIMRTDGKNFKKEKTKMDEIFFITEGRIETYQILKQINRHNVRGINVLATFSNKLHNLLSED